VRFYNRVLTQQEIDMQYTTSLNKTTTGSWTFSFQPDFSGSLKQNVFGFGQDSAGNYDWIPGKTLIRDDTAPDIQLLTPNN
jgi:hypothetical protein